MFDFHVTGDDAIIRTLQRLGDTPSRRALTKAIRRGGLEIVRPARAELRSRPIRGKDLLAKSLGTRVRIYPGTGTAVGIVGSRRGKQFGGRSRILHLVEFGHKKVMFGNRTDDIVQAHPFLTPAWAAKHQAAMDVASGVLAKETRAEAAKMGVRFG